MKIHPLAAVSSDAQLGRDIEIGPFCVIEPDTAIGDECRLETGVIVKSGTTLGRNNHIFDGTVLGGLPQHLHMPERLGALVIGSFNTIREHCTIHRALRWQTVTVVGDHNFIMGNVHIAHDCQVGNRTILANNVLLAGHVKVEDRAYLSGATAVHQFCRVGQFAMVGGQSHVSQDIPPYVTIDGVTTRVVGLNLVGLRRNGFTDAQINELKAAYRLIYRSGLKWTEILQRLRTEFMTGPAALFDPFFSTGTRGFVQERRGPVRGTIKLLDADPDADAPAAEERKKKAG